MHGTLAHAVYDKPTTYEKPTTRVFRFVLTMTLLLIVLAVEVGWVALLGYGLVFLFS
jgi:hypothetical protein